MEFLRALAVSFILACLSASASAQSYPDHPVTMLVGFPPGGADDTIARMIQDPLQKALGQTIVIENLGGAGGMIAAAKVAHAEPDGYTILLHQDALAAGMTLYPDLTFDAAKDFSAIGLVNTAPLALVARPTLPPDGFTALLGWMRQPEQNVRVGHPGIGAFGHLAGVLIMQELGVKALQVPYRGAGPALVDVLAGQVDLSLITAVIARPLVQAGKLKAYAIVGRQRFAGLPDLPTMGELGYPKLDLDFWHMLLAPSGTPRPIVDKLNRALRAALADEKLDKTFADSGMGLYPPEQETPEAASAFLKREIAVWGGVIRTDHIANR